MQEGLMGMSTHASDDVEALVDDACLRRLVQLDQAFVKTMLA
jgi:hypothetical protein